MKKKVLKALKPKVKSFGFNEKELMGVAAKIADNLQIEETATDDEVNAAIEVAVDAVVPYLSIGQSQASRVIDAWKKSHENHDDDDDLDDDTIDDTKSKSSKPAKKTPKQDDTQSEAMKGLLDAVAALTNEVKSLKSEKVTETRRARLEKMLKDTGTFGSSILKSFSRMKFENDEDYEDYISEVEENLKAHNQELADKGLASLGNPPTVGGGKKDEIVSDAEIDAIANSF